MADGYDGSTFLASDKQDLMLPIIEKCTVIASMIMIFSGIPTCLSAYRNKDVSNFPFGFFLIQTVLSVNGLVYGVLVSNNAFVLINFVAIAVSFFYLGIYLLVTRCNPMALLQTLAMSVAFSVFLGATIQMSPTMEDVADRVGLVGCAGAVILNALPILEVIRCFQKGDSSAIVMPLLLAGTINMVCWIAYGLLLKDIYIVSPNIPAVIVNGLRFVVLAILPAAASSHALKEKKGS